MINDHIADAFNPPKQVSSHYVDNLIHYLLGGFTSWDAQHFLHISSHGYIFEHSAAFFPLFPLSVNLFSSILRLLISAISNESLNILSASCLNLIYFHLACVYLYKLSMVLFNSNTHLAVYTVTLFCLNPANIFFSSIYSESMYSMLTFASIYYIYSKSMWIASLISLFLCCLCRSNGILNFGFMAYFLLKDHLNRCQIERKYYEESNSFIKYGIFLFKKYRLHLTLKSNILLIAKILISLLVMGSAFVLYQYYIYTQFCLIKPTQTQIPQYLVKYASEQSYVLMNDINVPKWCNKTIFSYSSIQGQYWNVGFLTYWTFRQIPNFLLAMPIVILSLKALVHYFYSLRNSKHLFNMLCLVSLKEQGESGRFSSNYILFPFAMHLIALLVSSVFFMHVQVKL